MKEDKQKLVFISILVLVVLVGVVLFLFNNKKGTGTINSVSDIKSMIKTIYKQVDLPELATSVINVKNEDEVTAYTGLQSNKDVEALVISNPTMTSQAYLLSVVKVKDGANVEIHDLVGDDNIYIFGDLSETVVERYANGSYCAAQYYNNNPVIKEAVDFITGSELMSIGDKERLERLSNELIGKDWFMTFPDFDAYVKTREQAYADYENRHDWAKKMLVNIAKAGYFSSDRTIEEYNRDIWKLEQ